jgi:hypothetical protein
MYSAYSGCRPQLFYIHMLRDVLSFLGSLSTPFKPAFGALHECVTKVDVSGQKNRPNYDVASSSNSQLLYMVRSAHQHVYRANAPVVQCDD